MRFIVIILGLLVAVDCFAEVVLYRYSDKVTGEERGICYGNKNLPPIDNKDWNVNIVDEKDKKTYIDLQKQQLNAQPKPKSLEERVSALESVSSLPK